MIREGDFLHRILERLREHPVERWGDITILLPGRRAGRKLTEALKPEMPTGKWLPHITTLGEWSSMQLGLHVPGKIELLVELQQIAESLRTQHALPEWGSFDRFQPWGTAALADFNVLDHHLIDVRQAFRDLRNIKDIESWSFNRPDLSPGQKAFLAQWNALHPLYLAFHEHLRAHGSTTAGMLARMMATEEHAVEGLVGSVWMAGANALTPAERKTVERLVRMQRAEWLWDTDKSYVSDGQIAGRFVRQIVERNHWHKLPHPLEDAVTSTSGTTREWNLITCSSRTMQTQYIRERLEKADATGDRTAIILPSSDIAPLVLSAIPPETGKVNLTMGVPLDRTSLRSFLFLLFGLHGDKGRFHHERLRGLLAHPLTQALQPLACQELQKLTQHCVKHTLIRLGREELAGFQAITDMLGPWWKGQNQGDEGRDDGTSAVLSQVARWTDATTSTLPKDPWLAATWMGFRDIVALHERCNDRTGTPPNLKETRARFQQWMTRHAVDLSGEPLEGLQVMGLLESRGLDFDEVYVLDVNEGTLPNSTSPPSFMPLDLQRSMELPGRPERDGIFSAYLHRLLHRAKRVHLLHVGADLGDNGTEPSRFLGQIEGWAKESLPGVRLRKSLWSTPLPDPAPQVPDLGWSPDAKESIAHMLTRGISPSALNQALTCQRQFHYRYVLGLGESETVEEHLEASTIGTVIHSAVEEGLKSAVGRVLTREDLKRLAEEVQPRLVAALAKEKAGAKTDRGENVLVLRMAAAMIGRWVRDELSEWRDDRKVKLIGLEEDLKRTFKLNGTQEVTFHGVADRVEIHEGPSGEVWQVVDYKTGKVQGTDLKLNAKWREKLQDGKHGKALQLLLYAAMLRADQPHAAAIRSTIRAGRTGPGDQSSLLTLNWEGTTMLDPSHDLLLQEWLGEVVASLLPSEENPTVFHNPDSTWCADCLTLE